MIFNFAKYEIRRPVIDAEWEHESTPVETVGRDDEISETGFPDENRRPRASAQP